MNKPEKKQDNEVLLEAYRKSKDPAIADQLLANNRGLVYKAVTAFLSRYFQQSAEEVKQKNPDRYGELMQRGMIGLYDAIKKYDPARGKFSTIAVKMIQFELYGYLEDQKLIYIPDEVEKNLRTLRHFEDEFHQQNLRKPTDEEITKALGEKSFSKEKLDQLRRADLTFNHLDSPVNTDSNESYADLMPDLTQNPAKTAESEAEREKLESSIRILSDREKDIVLSHRVYGKSFKELAEKYHISVSRTEAIEKAAIAKVRKLAGIQ